MGRGVMDLGLKGAKALVTGGTRGLGFSVAAALLEEGAEVVIAARDEQVGERAVSLLGRGAQYLPVDLAVSGRPQELLRQFLNLHGHIDILVLNAGGPKNASLGAMPVDQLHEGVGLVLAPMIELVEAVAPLMRARRFGRVVSISSYVVREPDPEMMPSNVARAGLLAYLKAAAFELAHFDVTVNSILPGLHATQRLVALQEAGVDLDRMLSRVPMGRFGDPDDCGHLVAYLCSRWAGYITGQAIAVDGGATRGLL
ncbi:SDR family oxidoreductase [Ferrimicrobium sp.]|uniref:SDR family oxidoreductase n=1 Tax=Ferrimicrobium sp. TaxID=2926050 RepID=UPI00262F9CAB|nr:SDR family oxidoreductase [Ferrimicrobium sp.]